MSQQPVRIAYLVTHPIQYQAPLLRHLAADPSLSLTVFFADNWSARPHRDVELGADISWGETVVEGYDWQVLTPPAKSRGPAGMGFWTPFPHGFAEHLRTGAFDVLWIHGYARAHHLWAWLLAKRQGIKVVLRDEVTAISRPRSWLKRMAKRPLLALLTRYTDGFFCVGQLNQAFWTEHGARRSQLFCVPYGVDNNYFADGADQARQDGRCAALRNSWGVTDPDHKKPILLFVGKLIDRKSPGVVLDALRILRDRHDQDPGQTPLHHIPHMVFVGDGQLRSALEQHAAPLDGPDHRVIFDGAQNPDALVVRYGACDGLVLPSQEEAWGLVVNEAMACGLPALVSDRVGCGPDLIGRDTDDPAVATTGAVFPARDTEALADRMAWFCRQWQNPEQQQQMRKATIQHISQYDTAEIARAAATALTQLDTPEVTASRFKTPSTNTMEPPR